ncbi:MAG TPA: 2-hydroxychromene-2-carboxylate isomerase [Polyangia bacterium]|jgi:2-hydroxychromene-2-carboxylate isomerase|nr:2-hydroxychromene-2-carboxylate isomerase [Polyangia bacterium]
MAQLRFYFDYLSPYAYLAWTRVHDLVAPYSLTVEPVPILLAALLEHNRTRGPAEVPARRAYLFRDIARLAAYHGIRIEPPAAHPFNPLLALRVSSLDMPPEVRRRLVDGLFAAVWNGGPGVSDPAFVAQVASAAGLDGPAAVAAAGTEEIKNRLRRTTEEAIAAGVFGVPTMILEREGAPPELFWGFDSFPHIQRFLDGKDPITPELVARWAAMPVGVMRKI